MIINTVFLGANQNVHKIRFDQQKYGINRTEFFSILPTKQFARFLFFLRKSELTSASSQSTKGIFHQVKTYLELLAKDQTFRLKIEKHFDLQLTN